MEGMSHSRCAVLLSALLASACGDDGASGDDGDGGAPGPDASSDPATAAGTALAAAYCEKVFQCCDAAEQMEELGFFDPDPTNPEECAGYLTYFSVQLAQRLITAEAEGRVELDLSQVEACAAAIIAAPCSAWDVEDDPFIAMVDDPACAALVVPLIDVGDACTTDPECPSGDCTLQGYVCDEAEPPPVGEPLGAECTSDFSCASRLCDQPDVTMVGVCVAKCDGM
jgi:hypothetical protein